MALTLRLAEVAPVADAVGSTPILLLDDALSELDPGTQTRVLAHVGEVGQVFLTSADLEVDEGDPATSWWEVMGGRVSEHGVTAVQGAA
jgi:recombinational DNA repair ATPase RecF